MMQRATRRRRPGTVAPRASEHRRHPAVSRPTLQVLEERRLLSTVTTAVVEPTAAEQYFLELVNRARANPAAEAQRLLALARTDPALVSATRDTDLDAFVRVISAIPPQPPLAFNPRLIEAARDRSAAMLATNAQTHSPPGYLTSTAVARADDGQAYYPTAGSTSWSTGENIYAYSRNVRSTDPSAHVDFLAAAFLIDWGNPSYGHLHNALAPGPGTRPPGPGHQPYTEIGIGLLTDVSPTVPPGVGTNGVAPRGVNVGPAIVTQEFAYRSGAVFLAGTFSADNDRSGFYSIGEGLGGLSIRAVSRDGRGVFQTRTWGSGGYSLQLPAGVYDVTATGAALGTPMSTRVAIGLDNMGWSVALPPATLADIPVPGDYLGTGTAILATYRAATGQWYLDGQARPIAFGGPNLDTPVPGDYDGLGRAELALYRASTGEWFVRGPEGGRLLGVLGRPGDIPVPGDYDGDGRIEPAVYRPSTAEWFSLDTSGTRRVAWFGAAGLDIPVPGDFDGLGRTEPAVYRPTTAQWFVRGAEGGRLLTAFGQAGVDLPVSGTFDGPGRFVPAVYRPTTGTWYVLASSGPRILATGGSNLDEPVIPSADLDGDGAADPILYRPAAARWTIARSREGLLARLFGQAGASARRSDLSTRAGKATTAAPSFVAAQALTSASPSSTTTDPGAAPPPASSTTPRPARPAPSPPPRPVPRWWESLTTTRRPLGVGLTRRLGLGIA